MTQDETNMLYSDWEHRNNQVTSELVHKGIEEAKINAELRAEIERLKAQLAQPEKDAGYVFVDGYRHPAAFIHTTPPKRKPLTHEQRIDLLAKFEAHKHEWHAPAILIDMVEAAHGIKE